ncbi:hypothetical protein [Mesorhizobium sp. LjNodule214]|uniref:hypothetical protein n=1 Tax=Mesorhizobium sp. LjNodule214 TaxID=3342252 RepID=UPI003ECDF702
MIFSLFRRGAPWTPAAVSENGEVLFTPEFTHELATLRLSDNGYRSEIEARTKLASNQLDLILQNPELRMGYELVPEIIAEYALRKISAPRDFEYVLGDRHGRPHSFKVAQHPAFQSVHDNLAHELLPASAVRTIAEGSSYAAAVSRALNAGEKLENLSVCVAPIGLHLHQGRLVIK